MGNRDFKLIKRSIHDISRNTGSGGKDYDKEIEELQEDVAELTEDKQDKLIAGDNVSINEENVISVAVPTKTSDLDNDSGYITGITGQDVTDALGYTPSDFSGDYNDLENKPTIPSKTSDLTNDSGFVDESYHDSTKQDVLTAGENITIEKVGNDLIISSTGGGSSYEAGDGIIIEEDTISVDKEEIQDKLLAGDNIKIDEETSRFKWFEKEWNGLTDFRGDYIWSDGNNIYYSNKTTHYVLDKSTSTWSQKTWAGLTNFSANNVWTDGDNIYYSYETTHYVLEKSTSVWKTKTWNGLSDFFGSGIWTDGDNIYHSIGGDSYVLNKANSTWSLKTWIGFNAISASKIWTDGENVYYSNVGQQYVLNKSTSTWNIKTWTGLTNFEGQYVWSDGDNIYCSRERFYQYVLNKSTSTWTTKSWTGLTNFYGEDVWTDGDNIYYSLTTTHYVLDKATSTISVFTDLTELDIEKMFSDELDSNAEFEEGEEGDILDVQNAYFEPNGDDYTLVINTDDASYDGSTLVLGDSVETIDGE